MIAQQMTLRAHSNRGSLKLPWFLGAALLSLGMAMPVQASAAKAPPVVTSKMAHTLCIAPGSGTTLDEWAYTPGYLLCRDANIFNTETVVFQENSNHTFTRIGDTIGGCEANCLISHYNMAPEVAIYLVNTLQEQAHLKAPHRMMNGHDYVDSAIKIRATRAQFVLEAKNGATTDLYLPGMATDIQVQVLADGSVGNVAVANTSGNTQLDNVALDEARRTTYMPAIMDGHPVTSYLTFHSSFGQ
jgi:TonB family protein